MEIQHREHSQQSVRLSNKSVPGLGDLDRFKNPGTSETNIKLARKWHIIRQHSHIASLPSKGIRVINGASEEEGIREARF